MGNWIDHFADNYNWSNATLVCKGMAPYGAVALDEIDRIGDRLQARKNDPDAWWQEWSAMARHVEALGDAAAAKRSATSRPATTICAPATTTTPASAWCIRASPRPAIYQNALRCFHAGLRRRYPQIEFARSAVRGHDPAGLFPQGQGVSGRAPTVVVFDGLDNCKEMSILFCGLEFSRRGFNALCDRRSRPGREPAAAQHLLALRLRGRRAAPPTTTSPRAPTSMPARSSSWAIASAAIARRASPRSTRAMPAASPSAPCTGTCMPGSCASTTR